MSTPRKTLLALALAAALPAMAQSNAELLNELKALKDRVNELEKKLQASEANKPQWGMTPEQAREFSRVQVKTEALEDERDAMGFKGLKISGVIDPVFIYNKLRDRAGFQFLNRVEDGGYTYDNSYMGAAVIDFQKETDGGTKWRLTLAPSRGIGTVFNTDSPIHEASVSIPVVSDTTRLFAGQIPDWSGYEYLPANQNKLITHNLLFDFTLPTAYVGAGVEMPIGNLATKIAIANVNTTMKSSDKDVSSKLPALVYRGDYELNEFSGFGFAGLHGKVPNFRYDPAKETFANLFEVDGWYTRGDLNLNGQLSYGTQKKAAINGGDSRWWGASVLAAYKFQPRLEGVVRFDYLNNKKNGGGLFGYVEPDDYNGIGPDPTGGDPNKGANRMALTLGGSYLFDENVTFKAEYRLDRANLPVFIDVKNGDYRKTNHLLGASVVVTF